MVFIKTRLSCKICSESHYMLKIIIIIINDSGLTNRSGPTLINVGNKDMLLKSETNPEISCEFEPKQKKIKDNTRTKNKFNNYKENVRVMLTSNA